MEKELVLSKIRISEMNNEEERQYLRSTVHRELIVSEEGKEHYKLLRYIAQHLHDEIIVDLGTHVGSSAIVLASNSKNQVYTYDVKKRLLLTNRFAEHNKFNNISIRVGNIFDLGQETILLKSAFIFLDTAHTGDFEQKVLDYLIDNDYQGFIIYDDIHEYEEMVSFWENIAESEKYTKEDITFLGHNTGTGLIDFTKKIKVERTE